MALKKLLKKWVLRKKKKKTNIKQQIKRLYKSKKTKQNWMSCSGEND